MDIPKTQLFMLSAKSRQSLEDLIGLYEEYLAQTDEYLHDICYTASLGRSHFSWRIALLVESKEELRAVLKSAARSLNEVQPVEEVVQSQDARALCSAYLQGMQVDWKFYYAAYSKALCKVRMPTYPFDRQRYWIERHQAPQSMTYGAGVHALLGARLPSSGTEQRFFNRLHLQEQDYLRAHRVFGYILFPGAAFMESALAAGAVMQGGLPVRVEELQLQRPLSLLEDCFYDYEVRIKPSDMGYEGWIESRQDMHDWVEHAQFRVYMEPELSSEMVSFEALKEQKRLEDLSSLYSKFAQAGLEYGPAFQVIEEAWVGSGCLLAKLKRTKKKVSESYMLHPAMLDGALQTMMLLSSGSHTFVPARIDRLFCYRALGNACWVLVDRFSEEEQEIHANLRLYDESGILVAQLEGFTARATDKTHLLRLLNPEEIPVYVEHLESFEPSLSHLIEYNTPQEGDWSYILAATPPGQRQQVLSAQIKEVVAQVLLQESGEIDSNKGFFDLGMDSLMMMELKNRLQQHLGNSIVLSNTLAFDYRSIDALVEHLLVELSFNESH